MLVVVVLHLIEKNRRLLLDPLSECLISPYLFCESSHHRSKRGSLFLQQFDKLGFRFKLGLLDLLWQNLRAKDLGRLGHHLGTNVVSLLLGLADCLRIDEMLRKAFLLDRHLQGLAQMHLKLGVAEHLSGDFLGWKKIAHQHPLFTYHGDDITGRKQFTRPRGLRTICQIVC